MPDKEVTRAGFGARAAAFIIDKAILFAALGIVRFPLHFIGPLASKDFLFRYSALDVLCWALAAAYFVALTYTGGATLGKRVMHLRVEKEDGSRPGFVDVLYRETVGRFLSGILCIGYLMVLADRKKRAFHDYLCDSCVVYSEVTFRTRGKAPGWTPAGPPAAPAAEIPAWSVPGRPAPAREEIPAEAGADSNENTSEDLQ